MAGEKSLRRQIRMYLSFSILKRAQVRYRESPSWARQIGSKKSLNRLHPCNSWSPLVVEIGDGECGNPFRIPFLPEYHSCIGFRMIVLINWCRIVGDFEIPNSRKIGNIWIFLEFLVDKKIHIAINWNMREFVLAANDLNFLLSHTEQNR